jgi:hypothetical protein
MQAFEHVLTLAQRFAQEKGRRATKRTSFSGPYIGIQWRDDWVAKAIVVTPKGEWSSVSVSAQATRFAPWWRLPGFRQPPSTGRGPWRVAQLDEGGSAELARVLEEAWDWLKSVDGATIAAEENARAEHVRHAVLPVLERFASDSRGRVAGVATHKARVEWPAPGPKFRLDLYYSDRNGFTVAGSRKEPGEPSEHGWVVYERILADLRLSDWKDIAGLSSLLEEARRRLEEGGPPGSSMTQLPPARM